VRCRTVLTDLTLLFSCCCDSSFCLAVTTDCNSVENDVRQLISDRHLLQFTNPLEDLNTHLIGSADFVARPWSSFDRLLCIDINCFASVAIEIEHTVRQNCSGGKTSTVLRHNKHNFTKRIIIYCFCMLCSIIDSIFISTSV